LRPNWDSASMCARSRGSEMATTIARESIQDVDRLDTVSAGPV
jgi:hypothetical protein